MKKVLSIVLAIISVAALFVGCGKKYKDPYADVEKTRIEINGQSDTLLEWDNKYDYNGSTVVLIWLENNSEKAYTVEVICKYEDSAGNEITSESNSFSGLSAGCRNCFIFKPRVPFETYSFSVNATPYEGETKLEYFEPDPYCKAKYEADPIDIYEQAEKIRLCATYSYKINNSGNTDLSYDVDMIIFDRNGKLFDIHPLNGTLTPGKHDNGTRTSFDDIIWEEGMKTPDELKGDLEVVFSVHSLN